jgi:hypothetical protein
MPLWNVVFFLIGLTLQKENHSIKSGDRNDIQTCRLIYVLCFSQKILEKVMCNRLISFLSRSNILTEAQNGFTKERSTETAIHSILNSIQDSTGEKSRSNRIFLWFNESLWCHNSRNFISQIIRRHCILVAWILFPVKPQVKFDNRDIYYNSEVKFPGMHLGLDTK